MTKTRCKYVGKGQEPAAGTIGLAWPAPGFSDPQSSQYMTFLFEAEHDHGVIHAVSPLDLDAITNHKINQEFNTNNDA